MDELTKIILPSLLTIAGTVMVFVAGQLLAKFIIEPIHDLKKILGEIDYSLVLHAPAIHTPIGKEEAEIKAQEVLRKLSCDLRSKIGAIPLYQLWASISCGFLPPKKKANEAAKHLMGLSNSVRKEDRSKNSDIADKIRLLLKMESLE